MKLSEMQASPNYFVINQAELSSRYIASDPNFIRPEWTQSTTYKGVPLLEYFRTSPEDQELVDDNGGDWGSADWEAAFIGCAIDVNEVERRGIEQERITEILKEFPEISPVPFGLTGCTLSGLN